MLKRNIRSISVIFSALLLLFDGILYKSSEYISAHIGIIKYTPKISFIDDLFPIIPAFITIYVLAYAFWFICPIISSSMNSRERYSDYITGFFFAYFFGFLILCLFPAVMDRTAEGIYSSLGNDVFSKLHLFMVTYLDAGNIAHGLLPSFHCLSSAYCYFGVMGCDEIPKTIRVFVLVFAFLIVLSTLFLKQHYFMDAITGITLAAVSYTISRKLHFGRIIIKYING